MYKKVWKKVGVNSSSLENFVNESFKVKESGRKWQWNANGRPEKTRKQVLTYTRPQVVPLKKNKNAKFRAKKQWGKFRT